MLFIGSCAKNLLDRLIHSLCLTICLGVKRATWAHPDVEAVSEVLPELRAEACITVADDGAWKTVVLDNVLPELICSFFSSSFLGGWN